MYPRWSTHWFKLEFTIPESWKSQHVRLQWESGSEALVWDPAGIPLQGINKDHRTDFILGDDYKARKGKITLYIEMACNTLFGAGDHLIGPPNRALTFTLSKCDLVTVDVEVHDLMIDIDLIAEIARELSEEDQRSWQALHTVNHMVNLCTLEGKDGQRKAKEVARKFFQERNGQSQFTIHVMGHAHIDTAWLWPYAETVRKCARTWSTALRLMETYPNYTFVCSQAQQFAWVKENYPPLFEKMKEKVKEGRFIPVGGTWVEMDGNIPSGEAFVRQFMYGHKFFMEEFGLKCDEFWLPDTFGYSAQLPQVMNGFRIKRFVTQKLSWSLVNKFPHSTFWWRGIDGSQSLSHFPPADTYGCKLKVTELLKTLQGHKDKGRTNHAILLYGWSDGGGGPTELMLERINRLSDTDGLPKIVNSAPENFFKQVEENDSQNLCTWVGELYLEFHQGTFTSQAKIKYWNRKLETDMQNAEKLYSLLGILQPKGFTYPTDVLDNCWKNLLLNQFHDVLPGSSINEVNVEACKIYEEINTHLGTLMERGMSSMSLSAWNRKRKAPSDDWKDNLVVFNPHSWTKSEVVTFPPQMGYLIKSGENIQIAKNGQILALVEAPSFGISSLRLCCNNSNGTAPTQQSKLQNGNIILENGFLRAEIDRCGRVRSLIHKESGLDAFKEDAVKGYHGNQLLIYDDIPLFWDAWDIMDYHKETRQPITNVLENVTTCENGPVRQSVKFKLKISEKSSLEQEISLDKGSKFLQFQTRVHWYENHKLLRVEFPFNVTSAEATYEIQFGHLKRPTHANTSWDWAKYEVVGHKWANMSQHNWGVALLNNCKYGHSTEHNVMRLSLLKSAKNPDENADMGVHDFTYAVFPHTGTFQDAGVIRAAYDLNNPAYVTTGSVSEPLSVFEVDNPAIILDTVKLPENKTNGGYSGTVIMRFYEAFGSHASGTLSTPFHIGKVTRCNLLEEEEAEIISQEHSFQFTLTPFQVRTFLVEVSNRA
ncbi:Alpha-mannosidase 2C1 [Holothuria leucospilota]|uniref:alpha-mannosidase n=1 Tax=Holothuria leucospilota TaxID=206669 RepID=A0A9Q1H432_HOLLE|nr:Alpha-mannosidase 2C1 [Holothuria leucospilota]